MSRKARTFSSSYTLWQGISPARIFPKIVLAMRTLLETGDAGTGIVAQNDPAWACDHRLAEHVLRPIVYHSEGEHGAGVIHRLISFFSPLRMMKDVSRGSFEERMAAHRHNRSMRGPLAACMRRWALCSSVAMVLT